MRVSKTEEGARDPLLRDLGDPFTAFNGTARRSLRSPRASAVLAGNEACPIQAFRYGDRAYGVQFHIEVTKDTVADWAQHIRPVMNEVELARKSMPPTRTSTRSRATPTTISRCCGRTPPLSPGRTR